MRNLTTSPRGVFRPFLNVPFVETLDNLQAHVAIVGMPYGDPCTIGELINGQINPPTAARRASQRILQAPDRHDFDIGGLLFNNRQISVVDVGDMPGDVNGWRNDVEEAP